jgi:hemolysin activation/secretion protein
VRRQATAARVRVFLAQLILTGTFAVPHLGLAQAPPGARSPIDLIAPQPAPRLSPGLEAPPLVPQTGPGAGAVVRIDRISVTGNEAIPTPRLAGAFEGMVGETLPLSRIEDARLAILRLYRESGYAFAAVDAGLTRRPDGSVDVIFGVVEGFVAEVKLEGDIGPAGTQVLRFLQRLVGVRPASTRDIERALLLASDVPGVVVRGTLRPLQTEPGALELIAQVERRPFSGFATIDNRGFRGVGPTQWLIVSGLNSFTEFGERTELSYFGAQDSTQWFAQGSVEAFIGGSGLRLRVYGGGGETRPTGALRAIGYYSRQTVGGLLATYPVIRSRPFNLNVTGGFDAFDGEIETGTSGRQRASNDQVRALRGGIDMQYLEARLLPFLPAATNLGSVRASRGLSAFGATRDGYPFSGRSGNETFSFIKVAGEVQRTQPLFSPFEGALFSLQGLVIGQYSGDILPQSEKCFLGGNRLGRGYYAGQVTGDTCAGFAVELQFDLAYDVPLAPAWGSNRFASQFYLFRDFARSFENLPTDPDRRLSSWGGGVRTVISDAVQLDVEGVHRVVRQPEAATATTPLKTTAFFVRALVRF